VRPFLITGLLLLLLPNLVFAGSEYATFQTFYQESSAIGWVLAGVFALIGGAVICFTGGTASPIVAGIGSWIGGMMGLSGIAATNAGLALLGGGAIASGGFGVIGGTALLTATLSFGTDVVVDYTIGKAVNEYEYSNLTKYSKKMTTLPLPMNDSGPEAYEDALKILEGIDKGSPVFSNKNQQIISNAIKVLQNSKDVPDIDESAKNSSLLSLLYFVSNDYVRAKIYASSSITAARVSHIKRTLPAFIYATSSLYEKEFNFTSITRNYFRYSILAEPDNPLIPLLFSIYLDRMSLRFNDGSLAEDSLRDVFNIMQTPSLEDYQIENYAILLSRYFIRLKLEQQKITSLASTSNETIKSSPKTLEAVRDSLARYDVLINDSNNVITKFISLELDDEGRDKATVFQRLLIKYIKDKQRLVLLIDDLKNYQDNLSAEESVIDHEDVGHEQVNWIRYTIPLILVFWVIIIARRRKYRDRDGHH